MSKTIYLLLLQAIFSFTLTYSQSTLKTICQKTPNPPDCVSKLKNAPGSSNADETELALIAANTIDYMGTEAMNSIKTQIRNSGRDPSMKTALTNCLNLYTTIIETDIPAATEAIERGKPKVAVDIADNVVNGTQRCADGFGDNSTAPILVPNKNVHELSVLFKSLASLLVV